MTVWIVRFAFAALASGAIYLIMALALVAFSSPSAPIAHDGIDFSSAITADYDTMPPLAPFIARDGSTRHYRTYGDPATARYTLLLVHGSGWHGMQFHPLAQALSASGDTFVVVPDLRGHGEHADPRGDIAYVAQLEDDLADLIAHISREVTDRPVILAGHSSGGGLAIRFAGGAYGAQVDGFILLAPFLRHDAPTTRPNSGQWAWPAIPRIVGLSMLGNIGITALDHLPVIAFAMPQAVIDGPLGNTVTTLYSHRLNTGFAPRSDYGRDLAAIDRPLLVIAGAEDEAFDANLYEPVIAAFTDAGTYAVLPGVGHIDLLGAPRTASLITDWLGALPYR